MPPLPLHSEYASECFNRRAFVSGFTGSAGTAVILKDEVISRNVVDLAFDNKVYFDIPTSPYPTLTSLNPFPPKLVWKALLWTDGRYHLQAHQQLSKGWTLMKAGKPSVPSPGEFLAKRLPKKSRVGIDPFVHSVSSVETLETVRSKYCCEYCCVLGIAVAWFPRLAVDG